MVTSEAGSAPVLQKGFPMRFVAVVILALVVGTGCGVGADETYDGQTLVTAEEQALEAEATGTRGQATQPIVNTTPTPTRDPGLVALPQDPIPVYEGRPVTAPPPGPLGLPGSMLPPAPLR